MMKVLWRIAAVVVLTAVILLVATWYFGTAYPQEFGRPNP